MSVEIIQGDCLEVLRSMEAASVDLVFCSPPYEAARTYGIDFALKGQEFVDWCVERYLECLRVCRGLVAWVIEGQTRKFRYSATPLLLMADLHRRGVHLRKPPLFHRVGIPGSGGPDWLRNDYEFIVAGTKGGRLSWSDNLAMGHAPKYPVGGAMSHRHKDGQRANQSRLDGKRNGKRMHEGYTQVEIANPGNVIKCKVGGGHMAEVKMVHNNEAPFPEYLAEFFVRSFCRPGGTVLDPFSGSGTTVAVAERLNRNGIGIDIRESQCDLAKRRLATVQRELIA